MGSVVCKKRRRSQRKSKDANTRAIILESNGTRSRDSVHDSSKMLTAQEPVVSFNNDVTSRLVIPSTEKNIPDKIDQENGSLSNEFNICLKEEFFDENVVFSSIRYSRNLIASTMSKATSITSTGTYQSFEPTPLTQVLPQLYLGTERDAQQTEKLIGLGITHVISIVGGGWYKDFYPKHMYIPLRDNGSSDLLQKLQDSYDFAMESQEHGNKLFVHCQLGQNRSASFVIGFLMKSRNLSFYEAYSLVKKKRELIHPHKDYIEQLRQLDLQLHKVYSTPKNFLDIAVSSKEEIKIMHNDFSKADSEAFKRKQGPAIPIPDLDGSQSTIRLPDFDDIQIISTVQ